MSSLFAPKPPPPPPAPKVTPPAPMPDEMSPGVLEARRKKQIEMIQRGGRSSTILSDAGSRGEYTGTTLG